MTIVSEAAGAQRAPTHHSATSTVARTKTRSSRIRISNGNEFSTVTSPVVSATVKLPLIRKSPLLPPALASRFRHAIDSSFIGCGVVDRVPGASADGHASACFDEPDPYFRGFPEARHSFQF